MNPTKLIYLENFTIVEDDAKVVDLIEEDARSIIILDQTIFYPQGGGQPYDKGALENKSGKFIVEEVRFVDGIVKHFGKFETGIFNINDIVHCIIDQPRRELNSRLHSAGHIVDMAVNSLALNWIPGKGYHFPEGPYIEYAGKLENIDREKLKADIESLCNKFILEKIPTKLLFMDKEEMRKICHHIPKFLPSGKPLRVVMYGDFGVPCGGTHVSNLNDVNKMSIRKIKQEGSNIRIGYDIS